MKRATQFVYLVGAYQLGTQFYCLGKSYYNLNQDETGQFTIKQNLNEKFGTENEWAVVTGASEGIGRTYALELAKAGYNLKICARSMDKLNQVAEKAKELNPKVQTEIVQLDVTKATPSAYAELFA